MAELRDLQQHFMQYVLGGSDAIVADIESTPSLSAVGRMDIYASAYKLRLKEAISTDYAILKCYLGYEQFDSVMETYIALYPSHITNLRYYSVNMATLLATKSPFDQLPVLAELATIEASFANSFDATDQVSVEMEDLAALVPEAWATLQLNFQTSVQVLSFPHNSFVIWKALSDGETPPNLERFPEARSWVVWRRADLISHYRPLDEPEMTALSLAMANESFAMICEALLDFFSEEETPMKAVSYLQSWIQEEMLAGLDY
jgi:hypothetical protein